jgi:glucose/arabinose dehydrogenase
LAEKVLVPDILVQAHSAPLKMIFYDGEQFPEDYQGDAFVALHGSWNRAIRTGYKVIRVPLNGGKPKEIYEDFLTGFVTPEGNVWGRPVGLTLTKDGALLVSEDGNNTIWRVTYKR